jgi:hypothetical protein
MPQLTHFYDTLVTHGMNILAALLIWFERIGHNFHSFHKRRKHDPCNRIMSQD